MDSELELIVNYPQKTENLENATAIFRATLITNYIEKLDVRYKEKMEIKKEILQLLKAG